MTKKHLIEKLAGKMGTSKADAEKALNAVTEALTHELEDDGGEVILRGFGTFRSKLRPAHMGRNPLTGAAVDVPAKVVVKFKATKKVA